MDGLTIIMVVLTIGTIIALERYYQSKRSEEFSSDVPSKSRASYREEAFAEIIKINDESAQAGLLDPLTGLPGRQIYDERLSRTLTHSKTYNQIFSVMILNIDEFKTINHVYGNVFGNKLLAEAANRLRSVLRQIDTVSRYAGDSYFFILPELSNPEVAILVAQRIQDSIIKPFNIEDHRIFVTASIGIAIYSPQDVSETLLKNAEDALTKAKLAGRNTYRIHNVSEHEHNPLNSVLMTYFLSDTFLEKMVMHYQPYLDINQNKTCAVQAIPYFNHPEKGLIAFQDFHKVAEECGKTLQLGQWALQKAIDQHKHWEMNGFKAGNMMVSVSITQLENSEFIAGATNLLNMAGVDKHHIIFDIEEFNIKANSQTFRKVLELAQTAGINISVSILALGRLALHNIFDFPINYLKIDDKLVKGLIMNVDNEAIIGSLVAIANNANIRVIAEGVDFETQKNKLIELGCTMMKGKLFSSAMPANELFDVEISKLHENMAIS